MREITTACQLLKKAQSAIVVFTRGNHFTINPDRSGSTGHWRIKADLTSEKVIVYYRKEKTNEVYTADFAGLTLSPETDRRVILLRNIALAGTTTSNWFKFGGRSQRPVQFIEQTAE
ncbi:MAG: hypothetical protein ACOYNY_46600 [Caldilineaceae bacterium]